MLAIVVRRRRHKARYSYIHGLLYVFANAGCDHSSIQLDIRLRQHRLQHVGLRYVPYNHQIVLCTQQCGILLPMLTKKTGHMRSTRQDTSWLWRWMLDGHVLCSSHRRHFSRRNFKCRPCVPPAYPRYGKATGLSRFRPDLCPSGFCSGGAFS